MGREHQQHHSKSWKLPNSGRSGMEPGPTSGFYSSWRQSTATLLLHCMGRKKYELNITNPPVTWNGGTTGARGQWKEFYFAAYVSLHGSLSEPWMIGHLSA